MDHCDRLIVALAGLVRAERETRAAFEAAVEAGLSREVLKAIVSDPVPVITQTDVAAAERFVSGSAAVRRRAA